MNEAFAEISLLNLCNTRRKKTKSILFGLNLCPYLVLTYDLQEEEQA